MMTCISKYDFSSSRRKGQYDFPPGRRGRMQRGGMTSLQLTRSVRREYVRYVAFETAIGIAINAILSVGLTYALFEAHVPMPGDSPALLRDIGTQCFIVALASVLVPTLLTRRRCQGGAVQGLGRPAGWLDNLLLRALLFAACATAIGVALLYWAVLPQLAPGGFTIRAFLAFKGTVGGLVAFAVTPVAVHLALGDTAPIGFHT
jgi:hypothetical protein